MIQGIFDALRTLGGPLAYLVVGLLAAGESSLGVGLVVPGETGMIIGGFLVSQGNAALWLMLVVAMVGAVGGDSVGYEIGRRLGPAMRRTRVGRWLGSERWETAHDYLADRGGKAIFFGRFLAVVRSLVPAVAGIAGMPYSKFLLWNAAGGILWASLYVTLGYVAGRSYEQVVNHAEGAGLILLAIVGTLLVVGLTSRWVARHPDEVRARLESVAQWPPIAWFRSNFGGPIRFVQKRFRVDDPFGLSVTMGLVFVVLTGWAMAVLVGDVAGHQDIVRVDLPVTRYVSQHRVAWLDRGAQGVTHLGSLAVLGPILGLVALVWFVRTRRWSVAVFLAVAVAGAWGASVILKELVDRARPPDVYAIATWSGPAFPSGHTTSVTAAVGALAYLHGSVLRSWSARVGVWTAAIIVALAVGFTRVYLGVHWLTDVLGGYVLGAAWLGIVVTAFGASTRFARARSASDRGTRGSEADAGQSMSMSSRVP